jgi:osmotically-inducible protein OsmY
VLLLSSEVGWLQYIVVQRSLFGPRLMVPASTLIAVEPAGLRVDLPAEALRVLPPYRSDADLTSAIRQTIANLAPIAGFEDRYIRVSVEDGVVTLTGHTTSQSLADQVEAAVAAVPGVLDVNNLLVPDDVIALDVAAALATEPRTRPYSIEVRVRLGVVTLTGEVPDPVIAQSATEVAARVPTVRAIVNQMTAPGFVPDVAWVEQPNIGEPVYAEDALVGTVERVVIDPRTRQPVGIIVAARVPEDPSPEARTIERPVFIPLSQINMMTEAGVFIAGRAIDAAYGPLASERTMPAAADWKPPFPYRPDDVVWPIETASPAPVLASHSTVR